MKFVNPLFIAFLFLFACGLTASGQDTDPDYVTSYRAGNNKGALEQANAAAKRDSRNGQAWYYLGLARAKEGNFRDARKSLLNAKKYRPNDARVLAALGWVSLKRGDHRDASSYAVEAIKLDPENAQANYVLAVLALSTRGFRSAYDRAETALRSDPNLYAAHRVKAVALVGSFSQQMSTVVHPPSRRSDLLKEAAENLAIYIQKQDNVDHGILDQGYLESVRFFAEYYRRKEINDEIQNANTNSRTPFKVLEKPKALVPASARSKRIFGFVRLVAQLKSDGSIGHILILTPLGYGLDESAAGAARKLRFEPARENGRPVDSVVTIDYSFNIF